MTPRLRHTLTLVAAVARNGVIGAAGTLPWRLPGDLARFRALTLGHALLMGRNTYASIGRPLPGRVTTVLSRRQGLIIPGVAVASDLAGALGRADHQAGALGAPTIMVVGGAEVYAQTIDLARALLITVVDAEPEGDAVFPAIDPSVWEQASSEAPEPRAADSHSYRFVRWQRRSSP